MNIFPFVLFALTPPSDTITKTQNSLLNEITVIAQRQEQNVFNTLSFVSVLNSTNLKQYQFRSTPEALFGMNGVFVQKTNHGGGSPFLRGLTGNQILTLIDGIRLNNSTFRYGPNQYLNTIDPFTIQNIEVLKGSGSVQYGSDALGGTLQIKTTNLSFSKTQPIISGNVLARYGTNNIEKTTRAEVSLSSQKVAFKAGISAKRFGDLIGGDTTGVQKPSGYDEVDFDLKGLFKLSDQVTLTTAHQSLNQFNVPVFHKVILENFALNEMSKQTRRLSYLKLDIANENRFFQDISLNISYQNTDEVRDSRKNNSSILRTENDQIYTIGSYLTIRSIFNPNWSASSGLEFYSDQVNSTKKDTDLNTNKTTVGRGLYPDASIFQSYALYSLHQLKFSNWDFNLGLRYNGYSIRVNDETLGMVNISPQALVGNFAIGYHFDEKSIIYGTFNSVFRAPNIDDMGTLGIVDFRYEVPTASLKPEKSYNSELGYKLKSHHFTSTIALYHNQLKDIITRVKVDGQKVNDYQVYRKENVEKGYIQGFEWATEVFVTNKVKIYTDLAYTYGQNETKNEPMRRIPPLTGRFGINYHPTENIYLKIEDIFAGKQDRLAQGDKDDNRIPKGGTNGWNIVNIYAGYEVQHFSITGSFQNIMNVDYRTHGSGINGLGRSLTTTIIYRF